jgi:hypothetical protein
VHPSSENDKLVQGDHLFADETPLLMLRAPHQDAADPSKESAPITKQKRTAQGC